MKDYTVKDFMTPMDEIVKVSLTDDIFSAAEKLEQAQVSLAPSDFRYRALLVVDETGKGKGMLTLLDMVTGLEPKYADVQEMVVSRFGYTKDWLSKIIEQYGLWDDSLRDICARGGGIKVRDIMQFPNEHDTVTEDTGLSLAIHQFASGRHHNLLVTNGSGEITGMIRLSNVYRHINEILKDCRV